MNRFNRDYALVRKDGRIVCESHNVAHLEALRIELAEESIVSDVIKSDLPRSLA